MSRRTRRPSSPCAFTIALLLAVAADRVPAQTEITIMSFNVRGAGANENLPLDATVAAIRSVDPDLVGLQEVRAESSACSAEDCAPRGASVASAIAGALGYAVLEQTGDNEALWANAVLSRYPMIGATPGGLGARIDVGGREVVVFNIHASDYPYQPYQLLRIPYGSAEFLETAAAAEASAQRTRAGALTALLADLAAAGSAGLWVITGDFNEPSHRDWTIAAQAAGLHPLAVRWPFTRAIEAAGFVDAFRAVYPDPVARPGFTWSPLIGANARGDHRDRIDYVFVRGPRSQILSAAVVGEPGAWSDIEIEPWPSDHRAVVTRVRF